jgi:hypothetical protein
MWHAWRRERCLQGFGWEARREKTTGRPRHRWESSIKMDLREIGFDGSKRTGFGWLNIGFGGGLL